VARLLRQCIRQLPRHLAEGFSGFGVSGVYEDSRAIFDQTTLPDERPDRAATLVVRVQLQQRLRPEAAAGVKPVDLLLEFGRPDAGEGSREAGVLSQQVIV
jgi:hypothetical protein